jgi:epoxide hydrolase 4
MANLIVRNIRGLDTAWLESGPEAGPVLFLLHGFPDSPAVWDDVNGRFSARFHVVRPFGRGIPPSQPARRVAGYGTQAAALDYLQILEHADPTRARPVWVVGHDMGAAQAWRLAPLLASRLRGLAILNGLSVGQIVRRLWNPRQQLKSWYAYFIQLPWLPEILAPRVLNAPRERIVAPLNQYRAMAREIPTEWRRGQPLDAPVLVLWGKSDPYLVPPDLAELQPWSRRLEIRFVDAGHWVMLEKPQEVLSALDEFFERSGE